MIKYKLCEQMVCSWMYIKLQIHKKGVLFKSCTVFTYPKKMKATDYNEGGDNWSNKISIILNSINCMHVYRNKTWCNIKEIENKLIDNYVTKWKSTIEKTPKLRTYIMFKNIFELETYIIKCMSRRRRSLMSQFRTGILPLEIETGRYVPIFDKTL